MSVPVREGVRPAEIAETAEDFLDALEGPTIFAVAGRDRARLRVVVGTLHGNEPSGARAIHRALREGDVPTTDVMYFIGAVEAARTTPRFSHRQLPGARDLNRCFRAPWHGPDGELARDALAVLGARRPEVTIDLHNNTGRNPSYAIGPSVSEAHLALASLFTTRFIHYDLALGSFTEAMDAACPSIAVECGRSHDPEADEAAWRGLDRLLRLDQLAPEGPRAAMSIYASPQRVELAPNVTLAFDAIAHPDVDLTLDPDVDRHNFQQIEAGTRIGSVRPGAPWPVIVRDPQGVDRSRELFELQPGGALTVRTAIIPVMLTTDAAIAASDCLFYAVQQCAERR